MATLAMALGGALLFVSTPAVSQTGNLIYSPNLASIPVGSTAFYLAVSITLAILGAYALRNRPPGSSLTGAVLLVSAVAVGELLLGAKVYALVGTTQSFLSNPQGGSVVIVNGSQNFSNNSGVPMRVSTLTPPCALANTAANACQVGVVLPPGASCDTEYACP
ncbi:MAG: midcut-by-XrtH protein [Halioglobus sp.]